MGDKLRLSGAERKMPAPDVGSCNAREEATEKSPQEL
jgi:hypothetical protein